MARRLPRCAQAELAGFVQAGPGLGLCDCHTKDQIRAGPGGQVLERKKEQPAHHANVTPFTGNVIGPEPRWLLGFSRFDVIHMEPLRPLPLVQVVTDLAPNEVP